MTTLPRLFPVIYSEKLEETKEFYCRLLDRTVGPRF